MCAQIRRRVFFLNRMNSDNFGHARFTRLQFSRSSFTSCLLGKPLSSLARADPDNSFLVSYLVNSCGLSSNRALYVSARYGDRLRFDSSEQPDSFLAFLRNHGFSDAHITNVVGRHPMLLSYQVEKTLLPKFEFLYSIGFTKDDLPHLLSKCWWWERSLSRCIIPMCSTIKGVLGSGGNVKPILQKIGWHRHFEDLGPNIEFLKENGMPLSRMKFLLRIYPSTLLTEHADFCKIVDGLKELGFDVSQSKFVVALHALSPPFQTTRAKCSETYKEWGWSDDDIATAFKRYPGCLNVSRNKLSRGLDFLMNKMECQARTIAENSGCLRFSFQRRILPRCSVIQVLLLKGLIEKFYLESVLVIGEKDFLKRYVTKYNDIAPELLSLYKQKLNSAKAKACHSEMGELK